MTDLTQNFAKPADGNDTLPTSQKRFMAHYAISYIDEKGIDRTEESAIDITDPKQVEQLAATIEALAQRNLHTDLALSPNIPNAKSDDPKMQQLEKLRVSTQIAASDTDIHGTIKGHISHFASSINDYAKKLGLGEQVPAATLSAITPN